MYYKEATEAISRCIASGLEDLEVLDRAISLLEQSTSEKIGTQRRIEANIDAMEAFQGMAGNIRLEGADLSLGESSPQKLSCQNVEISVRPEILLTKPGRSKRTLIGALKLYFPKTFPLTEDAAGYISAVLQEWSKTFLADAGTTSPPLCFVIDVGAQRVWPGVAATAQRMRDLQSYCRNILALWPTITPGADG
jgi:hypothetical protein